MSPRARWTCAAAALTALTVVWACGRGPDPAPPGQGTPAVRAGTTPVVGSATLAPVVPQGTPATPSVPDPEADARRVAEERRKMDEVAHDVIRAFQAKVHDPHRDDGLAEAAGTVRIDIDAKGATYRFRFDGTQPDGRQLTTETISEEAGLVAGAAQQARRFAFLAVRGGFAQVMSYTPPIPWQFVRSRDGKPLVIMPPHRSEVGVSYKLDDDGIVAIRGTTDGKRREVTRFTWDLRGEKRVLRASEEDGGKSSIRYVYDDDARGVLLLRHAVLIDGEHRCEAVVTWETVRKR